MKYIFILLLLSLPHEAATIYKSIWPKGEVFSTYLHRNGISMALMKQIRPDDLQYISEIQAGDSFYELRKNGQLIQSLIPVGEQMQIHLFKDLNNEKFHFDITPTICRNFGDTASFAISKGLYKDMNRWTNNPRLSYLLKKYYGKSINFKTLKKADRVSLIYSQRSRLGNPYGSTNIEAALIRSQGKDRFIFSDKGGVYYDSIYKGVSYITTKTIQIEEGKPFARPLKKMRITSKFTYKRWHPILKKYRPHLGVDIGARKGTKIYATHAGKVIYSGWMGGYGKAIKISHGGGFTSLYAHQSKLAVKKGKYIHRGQLIGHVGNTGRSTGAHLHFGLYLNHKAVDPMQYISKKSLKDKRTEIKKITKQKIVEIPRAKRNKKLLLSSIKKSPKAFRWQTYKNSFDYINDRRKYEK